MRYGGQARNSFRAGVTNLLLFDNLKTGTPQIRGRPQMESGRLKAELRTQNSAPNFRTIGINRRKRPF